MGGEIDCPNLNGSGSYSGELHVRDYGAHVHLLEEWNEEPFDWSGGRLSFDGGEAIVVHPFRVGTLEAEARARYRRDGEGDLIELTVHDEKGEHTLVARSA
jgi:hypothetical protein